MPYIGKAPSSGIRSRFIYTATAGQTTFTGADDNNKTLGYTDSEYVDVYLNGVLLEPADYTATSKTSVVLDSGATVGDTMEIVVYDTFSVFNGTFSGDLTVDGTTLVVDSTNNRVGVGTVSPAQPLHFKGSAVQFENTQNSYLQINTTDTHLYTAGAHPLRFGTNSTERMRIDSSGNVGIGTASPDSTLSIENTTSSGATIKYDGQSNGEFGLRIQSNVSGGNFESDFAVGGTALLDLFANSSTTSGGDILVARTQASDPVLLVKGNGNVGIGTSSPSAPTGFTTGTILDVANAGTAGDATDNASIRVSSANRHALLQLKAKNTFTSFIYFGDGDDDDVGKIQYDHTSNFMSFTVNTNEAMRIDSSPQILMGKTVANLTTAGNIIAANATSDGSPAYFYMIKTYDGTRNAWLNYHNGTYVGGINMTNTSTSFPTSSDERLKKNIVDAPSAGEKIDAMQVRSFNWKADDSFQEYGLIAQELQSVYDLPVEQHDIEDTYTVDYSKLVPVLLKEIQDLRKRVATLENN